MLVLSFANFKSRTLSHDLSGGCVMPHAEVHTRAQVSHESFTI